MERCKAMTLRSTSAHKVFTIAELLESILLLLPARDLFLLQRVNRVFRNTITRSNALQRVLWLRGSPADYDITSSEALDTNPILAVHIKTLYDRVFELDGKYYSFLRFDSSDPLKRLGWRGTTLVQHLFIVEHYPMFEEVIPTISPGKFGALLSFENVSCSLERAVHRYVRKGSKELVNHNRA